MRTHNLCVPGLALLLMLLLQRFSWFTMLDLTNDMVGGWLVGQCVIHPKSCKFRFARFLPIFNWKRRGRKLCWRSWRVCSFSCWLKMFRAQCSCSHISPPALLQISASLRSLLVGTVPAGNSVPLAEKWPQVSSLWFTPWLIWAFLVELACSNIKKLHLIEFHFLWREAEA